MQQTDVKIVHEKTFETIKSAVNKLVDVVKPTYGPAGTKVIIAKLGYFMVVDDGVQAARDFEITDPKLADENAIVKLVREVAIKTNDRVGDGTTSSLIQLQAIINEAGRSSKRVGHLIEQELKAGVAEATEQLKKMARPIKSRDELEKVARISFNDAKIAGMIADTYWKIGKDGIITIDKSPTMDTYMETTEGITLEHGYVSPYMITNPDRMEAVLEKPYILITDYRLTEATDIIPIMEKMVKEKKHELVVIAEGIENHALATAILNKMQGKFCLIAVTAPSGDSRTIVLEDLALLLGAKMFSHGKGDKLESAEVKDLGRAERFIAKRDGSIIVGPKGKKADIVKAIADLRMAVASENQEKQKKENLKRLAMFTQSIAVIKVGAHTENEQKALKYKVEDAVHAVKAAYRGGVVAGGGFALARVKTSSELMNAALKAPNRQLLDTWYQAPRFPELKKDEAYNLITGKHGDFMEVGVLDPVDALIAGTESAASIATILLTSHAMMVETMKEAPKQG